MGKTLEAPERLGPGKPGGTVPGSSAGEEGDPWENSE